jgi:hypothetical protein
MYLPPQGADEFRAKSSVTHRWRDPPAALPHTLPSVPQLCLAVSLHPELLVYGVSLYLLPIQASRHESHQSKAHGLDVFLHCHSSCK